MPKLGNATYFLAALIGFFLGWLDLPFVDQAAHAISEIFMRLLKLVSLPILFLSLLSTAAGMEGLEQFRVMGLRVVRYTLLTTMLAASVALGLFLLIDPTKASTLSEGVQPIVLGGPSYFEYLIQVVPSNIVQPFVQNHVIGVMIIALLFSTAVLTLPHEHRSILHGFFSALFATVMKLTRWIVAIMPLAVGAFVVLFFRDLRGGLDAQSIALYLATVVGANLVQGLIILPALLKWHGVSPWRLAQAMSPALSLAFFSKSSSASIPTAIQCATERAGISAKTANMTLPLCTTINMNGCAAFILATVLFVSMSQGMQWSLLEMLGWVVIATVAAVGNAGIPMGCYFLASAILASLNVPLQLLGVILPFYALIDMLETAINVWSDSCVTAIVEKKGQGELLQAPMFCSTSQ